MQLHYSVPLLLTVIDACFQLMIDTEWTYFHYSLGVLQKIWRWPDKIQVLKDFSAEKQKLEAKRKLITKMFYITSGKLLEATFSRAEKEAVRRGKTVL